MSIVVAVVQFSFSLICNFFLMESSDDFHIRSIVSCSFMEFWLYLSEILLTRGNTSMSKFPTSVELLFSFYHQGFNVV